ncbi:MAG: RES family NAD+ phosphorylase [Burkholderiaceae bacterium]|nr:RES family NAD+ phosphorylase [Burkholderiaceae bacterium]
MQAWRIGADTPHYVADDLTGTGAKKSGGRWNRVDTPMVYAASNIALACLETIVHLNASALPLNRYLVSINIPDALWQQAEVFDAAQHVGWDAEPAGIVSLDYGTQWVTAMRSAVLRVPSVIVPEEENVLINPLHADTVRITATKVRKLVYDGRIRA